VPGPSAHLQCTLHRPRSIRGPATVQELAVARYRRGGLSKRGAMLYPFSLPTKSDKVPAGSDWIHEIEVPHVRHQHIAGEPREQRLFAILPAARTIITSQAHHGIGPFGERWRAIGHSSALKQ
jgi:hypothetical protein